MDYCGLRRHVGPNFQLQHNGVRAQVGGTPGLHQMHCRAPFFTIFAYVSRRYVHQTVGLGPELELDQVRLRIDRTRGV